MAARSLLPHLLHLISITGGKKASEEPGGLSGCISVDQIFAIIILQPQTAILPIIQSGGIPVDPETELAQRSLTGASVCLLSSSFFLPTLTLLGKKIAPSLLLGYRGNRVVTWSRSATSISNARVSGDVKRLDPRSSCSSV